MNPNTPERQPLPYVPDSQNPFKQVQVKKVIGFADEYRKKNPSSSIRQIRRAAERQFGKEL